MQIINYILIFLTALCILIAIILGIHKCEPEPTVVVRSDTTYVPVERPPLNIDSIKATVKPKKQAVYIGIPEYITILDTLHDTTLYVSPAYSACFDTIINKDTMGVEFDHPETVFRNFYYKRHPDSVQKITTTITIQLPATFGQKMEYGLYSGIGGAVVGGVLGFIEGYRRK